MDLNDRTHVSEVMSAPLETIGANEPLREAARRMTDDDISALVVTTGGGCIVTQSDIGGPGRGATLPARPVAARGGDVLSGRPSFHEQAPDAVPAGLPPLMRRRAQC